MKVLEFHYRKRWQTDDDDGWPALRWELVVIAVLVMLVWLAGGAALLLIITGWLTS